jgi:hypothetical protein
VTFDALTLTADLVALACVAIMVALVKGAK